MNIALFTPSLRAAAGGPPRVVLGSAAALAARGHRVTVFTLAVDHPADAPAGVEILACPVDWPRPLARSRALRRAVAQRIAAFDVLHVHAVWEGAAGDLAALFVRAGKPVFVSAHGMLDRWSMAQSRAKKRLALRLSGTRHLLGRASGIVFATHEEAGEAASIAPATPRAIIANGIDGHRVRDRVAAGAAAFRTAVPHAARWSRTIVYLSRIHPKKGIDQLVEARLALDPRFDDVGMLIVGIAQDTALLDTLRSRIAESRLADRFVLTTDLVGDDAMAALGVADLFALPSHQEGFSIAILEAMAAGLPVLITDKCHLPEIATWNAGAVVPDTVAGLTRGLERLLALPAPALAAAGQAARAAVDTHYGWPVIAAQLETLYRAER